jgi:hypothetical protein
MKRNLLECLKEIKSAGLEVDDVDLNKRHPIIRVSGPSGSAVIRFSSSGSDGNWVNGMRRDVRKAAAVCLGGRVLGAR